VQFLVVERFGQGLERQSTVTLRDRAEEGVAAQSRVEGAEAE